MILQDPSPVIKKAHYGFEFYKGVDYIVKHWDEKLISKIGKHRLTEKMFEFIHHEYGYEPVPEIALKRRLQVKRWWGWKTIREYSFRVENNIIIKQAFLGYNFDWEATWNKMRLNVEELIELNRKK